MFPLVLDPIVDNFLHLKNIGLNFFTFFMHLNPGYADLKVMPENGPFLPLCRIRSDRSICDGR